MTIAADLSKNLSIDDLDVPVAWLCSWRKCTEKLVGGKLLRPKIEEQRHATKDAADAQKLELKARFGEGIACCVTAVPFSKAIRSKTFRKHQQDIASAWPVQKRPKKRGS